MTLIQTLLEYQVAFLAFRGLPFLAYLAVTGARGLVVGATLLAGLCGLLAGHASPGVGRLIDLLASYAYLVAATCVLLKLRSQLPAGTRGKAMAAGLVVTLFGAVPVVALRWLESGSYLPLLAWFVGLSAYSLIAEEFRSGEHVRFGGAMTFLLVNPALVYADRGKVIGGPAWRLSGGARLGEGLLLVGAAVHLMPLASQQLLFAVQGPAPTPVGHAFGAMVGFVMLYMQHVGLASFQIGGMELLGYEVPEQYRRPYLARNPSDFWRRWNTYVGGWLRRYVFEPCIRALRHRVPSRKLRAAVACMVTFAVAGLLHDAGRLESEVGLSETRFFLFCGAMLLAWAGLQSALRRGRIGRTLPHWFAAASTRGLAAVTMVGTAWFRTQW